MSEEQVQIVMEYHDRTPEHEAPLWVHGLVFTLTREHYIRDLRFPWDYGLTMDVQLLSIFRGGEHPFEYLPGLWELLVARDRELAIEQDAMS